MADSDLLAIDNSRTTTKNVYEFTPQDRQAAQSEIQKAAWERYLRVGQNIVETVPEKEFYSHAYEYGRWSNVDKNLYARITELDAKYKARESSLNSLEDVEELYKIESDLEDSMNERLNFKAQSICKVYEDIMQSQISTFRKSGFNLAANPTLGLRAVAQEIYESEPSQQFNAESEVIKKYFNVPSNKVEKDKFMQALKSYCEFALVQKQNNLTGEFVSPEAAREMGLDVGAILIGGMLASAFAAPTGTGSIVGWSTVALTRGKRITNFLKQGTAFFAGMNASNVALGRWHRVDLSLTGWAETLALCGIMKGAATAGRAGFSAALNKYLSSGKAVTSVESKGVEALSKRIEAIQKNAGIAVEEFSQILALSAYGVARSDGNMLEQIEHNLVFLVMLRVTGKGVQLAGSKQKFNLKADSAMEANIEKDVTPRIRALSTQMNPVIKDLETRALATGDATQKSEMEATAMRLKWIQDDVRPIIQKLDFAAGSNQPPKNYVGPKPTIDKLDPAGARKIAKKSQEDILFDGEQLFQDLLSKKITNDFRQSKSIKAFVFETLKDAVVVKPAVVEGYLGQKISLDSPLANALSSNPAQASENLVSYKDIEYLLQTPGILSNAEMQQMYVAISDAFLQQNHLVSTLDHQNILKAEIDTAYQKLSADSNFKASHENLVKQLWKDYEPKLAQQLKDWPEDVQKSMLQNYYQKFNDALFKVNVILFVNQSQKLSKAPIDLLSRDEMEALPPSEVGPSVLYQKVLKKSYCLPISLLTVEQLRLLGTQAYLSHPIIDKAGQAYYFNRNEHITVEIPITSGFVIEVDPTFFDAATDYTKPDTFAKNLKDVYRIKPNGSKRLSFFQGLSLKIVDMTYASHEEEQKAADLALSIDPFNWKGYFLKAYATQNSDRPTDATAKMNWYMDIMGNYRMASLSQPLALKPRENAIILGLDLMRDSKIATLDSQKMNQFTDQWLAISTEKPFFVALRKEIEKNQNNLSDSALKDVIKKSKMLNLEELFDMYNSVIKRSFDYYRGSPEKIQLLKNRVNVIVNELVAIYREFPQFAPDAKSFLEKLKAFREGYGG